MIRQRDAREREKPYLGWVARLPCVACMSLGKNNTRVQVAHLRAGSLDYSKRSTGMAEKPSDAWTLPLCMPHHTGDSRAVRLSQHRMGELDFWAALAIDPFALCIDLHNAYLAGRAGGPIITLHAARGRRAIEGATT